MGEVTRIYTAQHATLAFSSSIRIQTRSELIQVGVSAAKDSHFRTAFPEPFLIQTINPPVALDGLKHSMASNPDIIMGRLHAPLCCLASDIATKSRFFSLCKHDSIFRLYCTTAMHWCSKLLFCSSAPYHFTVPCTAALRCCAALQPYPTLPLHYPTII